MVRVSYETVLDWIGRGDLNAYQLPSGQYLIAEYDADQVLLPVGRPSSKKAKRTATKEVPVWSKAHKSLTAPRPVASCASWAEIRPKPLPLPKNGFTK